MKANAMNLEHSHIFRVEEDSDWLVLHADPGTSLATWTFFHLRDPLGRLRYQHLDVNSPRSVTIHRDLLKTSLNGVGGPIPAGDWRIDFLAKPQFKLFYEYGKGNVSFTYRPSIPDPARDVWATEFDGDGCFLLNRYDWDASREEGGRWYKGDCHLHTSQSDGCLTPDQLSRQAREAGLDYIAATDHNIVPTSWPKTDLLVIPGTEITARSGHWNALGLGKCIDFNRNLPDGGMSTEHGMNRLLRDAGASGAVCSINHPMSESFEWTLHETELSLIDAVEIINAPQAKSQAEANEKALLVWNVLWNEGYRKTGIGGSDFHFNTAYYTGGVEARVGSPTTYVYASRLSAREILNGIRAGRVCVTAGPELVPAILVNDRVFQPGADLTEAVDASADGIVRFRLHVKGMAAGQLCWIENGRQVQSAEVADGGMYEAAFAWKGVEYAWGRAEIRSTDGELIGFTNPVSYGSRTPEIKTWGQAMDKAGLDMLELKPPGGAGW